VPAVTASVTGLTVSVGAAQPEIKTQTSTPQRIFFPCTITFAASAIQTVADGGIFPAPGNPPAPTTVVLTSAFSVPGSGTPLPAETNLQLEPGADPYFANFAPGVDNEFWHSQDLRVFTVTPRAQSAPIIGIPLNASDESNWDTGAAYAYIQTLLGQLNSSYGDPSNGDAFALFPDQTNALSGDASVTPFSIDPSQSFDPTNSFQTGFPNYNFAVARVRLNGAPTSSSVHNVRVLFRVFASETGDTDYQLSTYPATNDSEGQPLAPVLGTGNVTIPFFATGNYESNTDFAANVDYTTSSGIETTSINNQPVSIGASGDAYAYYGCYLNFYNTDNTINNAAVQTLLPSSHSCVVAQIAYDDAPMPTGPGVLQGPEYTSNFAQRNL
jgi:hypothetical protein